MTGIQWVSSPGHAETLTPINLCQRLQHEHLVCPKSSTPADFPSNAKTSKIDSGVHATNFINLNIKFVVGGRSEQRGAWQLKSHLDNATAVMTMAEKSLYSELASQLDVRTTRGAFIFTLMSARINAAVLNQVKKELGTTLPKVLSNSSCHCSHSVLYIDLRQKSSDGDATFDPEVAQPDTNFHLEDAAVVAEH